MLVASLHEKLGRTPKIGIVGAGVIGRTQAFTFLEMARAEDLPLEVVVWTKDRVEDIVSSKAAAFWDPFLAATDDGLDIDAMAGASYEKFREINAAHGAKSGVESRQALLVYREPAEEPTWKQYVDDYQVVTREQCCRIIGGELPAEITNGITFRTWMVEMPIYLAWLGEQIEEMGGRIVQRHIHDIRDAIDDCDMCVNCSGLGSRDIRGVQDSTMFPIAGQIVKVRRKGEDVVMFDPLGETPDRPGYVVPRSTDLVLGGTAVVGQESTDPDPAVTADIIERCRRLYPGLRVGANDIESVDVGLRPGRPTIRLEAEWIRM